MADRKEQSRPAKRPGSANVLVGLIILTVGVALLIDRLDFMIIPHWLITWPMLVIVLGFLVGAKKNFRGIGWLVLILIGTFFLFDNYFHFHWDLHRYGLPIGIIVIGVFLLFRSVSSSGGRDSRYYTKHWVEDTETGDTATGEKKRTEGSDDYIEQVNVFGGTKSKIFSKKFKGGESINFFGSAKIDLTQADIEGKAVLELVQVFGGVTLIIPANWTLKTDAVNILGGLTDKRPASTNDSGKMLVITGVCIFGGIEIRSY